MKRENADCTIQKHLWELQDAEYKNFHSKLIPDIPLDQIIGVRTPALRSYAKELLRGAKKDEAVRRQMEAFMADLPHAYYDENNLHGFLIEGIKDYELCLEQLNRFLPYVDNWATCDLVSPKVLGKDLNRLLPQVQKWMDSDQPYIVRYGIEMLMRYYLDEAFEEKYLDWVAAKCCEAYYVNMMVAWYFATALAKQYDRVLPYMQQKRLPDWTHNKTIQKAVESNRITKEQKIYLRTLKV